MKWSKRVGKGDREGKVSSICFTHFWPLASQGLWLHLGMAGLYKPLTSLPLGLPSVITSHLDTAEEGSTLASCPIPHFFQAVFTHTQAHCTVIEVQQKMCLLREQRNGAPSILTFS